MVSTQKKILEIDNRSKRNTEIFIQGCKIREAEKVRLEKMSGIELVNEHLQLLSTRNKQMV